MITSTCMMINHYMYDDKPLHAWWWPLHVWWLPLHVWWSPLHYDDGHYIMIMTVTCMIIRHRGWVSLFFAMVGQFLLFLSTICVESLVPRLQLPQRNSRKIPTQNCRLGSQLTRSISTLRKVGLDNAICVPMDSHGSLSQWRDPFSTNYATPPISENERCACICS